MRLLVRTLLIVSLSNGLSTVAFSQLFNLNAPTITGQRPTPLITEKNTAITIAFQNLRVSDPDIFVPGYPQGFTLKVFEGSNYTLVDATVTPNANFVGTLTVQVQVNDGKFDSNIFDLKIDVINIKPEITDQESISIKEGSSVTLQLSHLKVKDDDNIFPDDFTLTVSDGSNYSINGNTIIPDPSFTGDLKVLVSVNDSHEESDKFEVKIQVKPNIIPEIKGQVLLSVNQGKKITIELGHLTVEDADNAYPTGFALKIYEGTNYAVNGNTITPIISFTGTLKVPVTVHDGQDESKKFELKIEVLPKNNIAPKLNGQDALVTNEDQSITITLADLIVSDPDNTYPNDFILKIPQGAGASYSVSGTKITPALNFNGVITVPVRVNDGLADSEPFQLSITVTPVNDVPVITGQNPIFVPANRTTSLDISRLSVSDPDKQDVSAFPVKILPGTNYTASGNSITPANGFTGTLTVRVVVNDGVVDSAPFNLKVEVIPPGSKPLITGQQPLVVDEDKSITIKLGDLFVTDEDDHYPDGFTMKVLPGGPDSEYNFDGLIVTPPQDMNGLLVVNVTVHDGNEDSPVFPLKIYVIPVNDAPRITNLESTLIPYEPGLNPTPITEELQGEDIDNEFLSFAEIGLIDTTFNVLHDELLFENTDEIRGIFDSSRGILSLIGYASLSKYDSAIRSVKYNYKLTLDDQGNQSEVLPGQKKIYFSLSDGQLASEKAIRTLTIESSADLDIPNVFTPNGDKAHDTWKVRPVVSTQQFDKAIVKVYNKKGLLVFETKGFDSSWDGSFNGELMPVDTYYYTIDLKLSYTKKTYKGTVTILR
jgi:gliding motility-associated-like protein